MGATRAPPTARIMLRDGTLYFSVSLAINVVTIILGSIALNAPDNFYFSFGPIVAGVVSTMVASRAVRHLSDHMARKEILLLSDQKLSFAPSGIQFARDPESSIPAHGVGLESEMNPSDSEENDIGLEDDGQSFLNPLGSSENLHEPKPGPS